MSLIISKKHPPQEVLPHSSPICETSFISEVLSPYLALDSSILLHMGDLAPINTKGAASADMLSTFQSQFSRLSNTISFQEGFVLHRDTLAYLCTARMTLKRQARHAWTVSILLLLTKISFHDQGVKNICLIVDSFSLLIFDIFILIFWFSSAESKCPVESQLFMP